MVTKQHKVKADFVKIMKHTIKRNNFDEDTDFIWKVILKKQVFEQFRFSSLIFPEKHTNNSHVLTSKP